MGISGPEKTGRSRINSTLEPCVISDVSALWYEETLNHHAAGGYHIYAHDGNVKILIRVSEKKLPLTLTELRWGENSLELLHMACLNMLKAFKHGQRFC